MFCPYEKIIILSVCTDMINVYTRTWYQQQLNLSVMWEPLTKHCADDSFTNAILSARQPAGGADGIILGFSTGEENRRTVQRLNDALIQYIVQWQFNVVIWLNNIKMPTVWGFKVTILFSVALIFIEEQTFTQVPLQKSNDKQR